MAERKRTVEAGHILRDIRSGKSVSQLIDKYGCSVETLRMVFRKLIDEGTMTKEELDAQKALYSDNVNLKGARKWPRTTITRPLRIYDSGSPFATGYLRNISEKGVCVEGIEAATGDIKNFVVHSGAFGADRAFVFEGKCRWVNRAGSFSTKCVAGFEITSISGLDLAELRKLVNPERPQGVDTATSKKRSENDKSDAVRILNVLNTIRQYVDTKAPIEPYLFIIGDEVEQIARAFDDRLQTAKETLKALASLVIEMRQSKKRRADAGLSPEAFAVYWYFKKEDATKAYEVAGKVESVLKQHLQWRTNASQEQEIRLSLYKVLLSAGIDGVVDVTQKVMQMLRRRS